MNARTSGTCRRAAATAGVVAALLSTGCASTPQTHWHTLLPANLGAAVRGGGAAAPTPIAISVAPVRVPAQVDRAQWLVRLPDDSVAVLEQERWASPLPDEIRLALVASLAARDGAVEAPVGPNQPPSTRVAVDVRRFESLPGRESRIEGTWTLSPAADGTPARCDFLYREPAAAGGFDAIADGHARAVMRLAAAIGDGLQKRAACPASDAR